MCMCVCMCMCMCVCVYVCMCVCVYVCMCVCVYVCMCVCVYVCMCVVCCVLCVVCCVLCVVCCVLFHCFTVSLFFNACDVTTKLAPDAPSPRRNKTDTEKTAQETLQHPSDRVTSTPGAELLELRRVLFALSPIPNSAARCSLVRECCPGNLFNLTHTRRVHGKASSSLPSATWEAPPTQLDIPASFTIADIIPAQALKVTASFSCPHTGQNKLHVRTAAGLNRDRWTLWQACPTAHRTPSNHPSPTGRKRRQSPSAGLANRHRTPSNQPTSVDRESRSHCSPRSACEKTTREPMP